ncbi:competence-damage inducible protein CinA [Bifidobacterium bombi DSM 19703]|uniref:Competence-damage inducible protein CinA n=2 Tax=Bifidobacterium bombi TaxID=471511 RepID=A0A080N2X2_9BIFI|nr:competence-damage inducible protein CinA [Bifidobacterium bombi DSM 19703]
MDTSAAHERPSLMGDEGDFGPHFAPDQERRDRMAASILRWAGEHDLKIAVAESLTAGLLADAFVRIPGASSVFLGSAVTYDIRAKASILSVDAGLLSRSGAVHPQVASQMACGAARLYDQREYGGRIIGLSTTGVAGPGPDGGKPAGLVYVGVALPGAVFGKLVANLPGNGWSVPEDPNDGAGSSWAYDAVPADGTDGLGWVGKDIELHLSGTREAVRRLTVQAALQTVMSLTSLEME